jgi:hypothetical protein
MRQRALIVGTAVIAAALGGCTHAASDPVIYSDWDGEFSRYALLSGPLRLQDGCLVVGDEGAVTPVAFPRMYASWDPTTQTLTYNEHSFAIGDAIEAGGGGGEPPTSGVPEACRALVDEQEWVFYVEVTDIRPGQG